MATSSIAKWSRETHEAVRSENIDRLRRALTAQGLDHQTMTEVAAKIAADFGGCRCGCGRKRGEGCGEPANLCRGELSCSDEVTK